METKENFNLEGKLCYFGKEIVLVLEKKKILLKFAPAIEKYISYDVLFSSGGIDQVGEKSLKIT